jgi:predicted permease
MEELKQNLIYALRTARKMPGFTAITILILALGIGANSAIFSLVNAVLLRPLPVQAPAELVNIYTSDPDGTGYSTSSYPDFESVRQLRTVFKGVLGYAGINVSITGDGRPQLAFGEMVSDNYFSLLGVQPALGRAFTPEEGRVPGGSPVAVISHGLWQQRFGSDPGAIGKTLSLNGRPFTVVGVAPESFKGLLAPGVAMDVWVPTMMVGTLRQGESALSARGERWLFIKGRLASGVSLEQSRAAVTSLGRNLEASYPDTNAKRVLRLLPTSSVHIHPAADGKLLPVAGLLMIVVGLVLLVACSNIGNLLLARLASRRFEMAVRLALGARRGRLIRQMLTESVLLGLVGGGTGLLLAYWLSRLLVTFRPSMPVPISLDVTVDARVLIFTLLLSLVTGALFGLLPALQAARPNLVPELKGQMSMQPVGHRRLSARNLLVVAQVAVSLLLLICAGLFLRSLQQMQAVDLGFTTRQAAIISFNLGLQGYDEARGRRFYRELRERAERLPGAQAASLTDRLPLNKLGNQSAGVLPEGRTVASPGDEGKVLQFARISPGFFQTLGIPLLRGRDFSAADTVSAPQVAVVNQAAATVLWPDADPVGKRLRTAGPGGLDMLVVGLVGTTKLESLREPPQPCYYVPFEQSYSPFMAVAVKSAGAAGRLLTPLRSLAGELDRDAAVFQLQTLEQHLGIEVFPLRLTAILLSLFGLLALLLASIGLYGVMSFSVVQRNREIGIRMALGADRSRVLRLVVAESLWLVGAGLALGILLSAGAAALLSNQLFGIAAADPLTFVAVPLLLLLVALLASYLPGRKATRVDPMVALRNP